MKRFSCLVVLALAMPILSFAQMQDSGMAGGVPSGRTPTFKSDFTGTLKAFDPATKTLTLVREKKGKEETFTGMVAPHVEFNDKSGAAEKKRELSLGETLKVYYEQKKEKGASGEMENHNVISRIDLLHEAAAAPKQ